MFRKAGKFNLKITREIIQKITQEITQKITRKITRKIKGQKRIKNLFNICTKIYKKRSLFLALLLFIFSSFTPVLTKAALPTIVAQAETNGQTLSHQAMGLYRQGKFTDAVNIWQQAIAIFIKQGDSLNQAMAWSNIALSYQQLAEWEQAKQAINESFKILTPQVNRGKQVKTLELFAQALEIQGALQRETGQLEQSLESWQKATKIYTEINAKTNVLEQLAQSKINQAQNMQDMGFYHRACKMVLEVVDQIQVKDCQELNDLSTEELQEKLRIYKELYKNESPSMTKVLALRSLGKILVNIRHFNKSRAALETSSYLAKKLNVPEKIKKNEIAENNLSLANIIQAISEEDEVRRTRNEKKEEALKLYQEVIDSSSSQITQQQAKLNKLSLLLKDDSFGKAQRLNEQLNEQLNYGKILEIYGNIREIEQLWKEIKLEINSLSPSHTNLYLQLNFAQNLVKLPLEANNDVTRKDRSFEIPTFQDVEQILTQTRNQSKQLGDKSAEAYAIGYQGRMYEFPGKNQDLFKAEKLTKQALDIASTIESPDINYQFFSQLGRIYQQKEDIKNSIDAYTKAYDSLQSLRRDLIATNPEVQYSFRNSIEPVYRQLVKLNLEYASSLENSLQKANKANKESEEVKKILIKSRDVIESLQLAEINNFFQEACVAAKPKKIDEIDKETAVIYGITLPGKLGVILSLPNGSIKLNIHEFSQEKLGLKDTVENVRQSLSSPYSNANSLYKNLYSWLIQPFEEELEYNKPRDQRKIKNLAFVLDGELRNIPMSILLDRDNKYLIEEYAIALTPGLQLVDPKPITDIKDLKVLTAGLSKVPESLDPEGIFGELPNVQLELESIQKLGLSSEVIFNEDFLTSTVERKIDSARFPIVHLATHGQFSSDVEDTFILAWDKKVKLKDLKDWLENNQFNQVTPIELLVLSACQTAEGDKYAALGLAGVAVNAGARSTLATLWSVADESTAKLMDGFYQSLKDGQKTPINKIQALQEAQLSLMKDEKYNHPHFWAPYVIVGNWQ